MCNSKSHIETLRADLDEMQEKIRSPSLSEPQKVACGKAAGLIRQEVRYWTEKYYRERKILADCTKV